MLFRLLRPVDAARWWDGAALSIERAMSSLAAPKVSNVADVPPAAANTGRMIFVPDEAGGAVMAFSDGTNWRRVTDRVVIS